jgi:hypothetical protein
MEQLSCSLSVPISQQLYRLLHGLLQNYTKSACSSLCRFEHDFVDLDRDWEAKTPFFSRKLPLAFGKPVF